MTELDLQETNKLIRKLEKDCKFGRLCPICRQEKSTVLCINCKGTTKDSKGKTCSYCNGRGRFLICMICSNNKQ